MKLVIALMLVCVVVASSSTVNVPSQYATIQDAVNATLPHDTILLDAGVYNQPAFTLLGYGPRLIKGTGMESCKLEGGLTFEIVGGTVLRDFWKVGGFFVYDGFEGDIEISGVRLSDSYVGLLVGTYSYPHSPQSNDTMKVTRCIFENTQHYGIQCEDGHLVVEHCCFRNSGWAGISDNAIWCGRDATGGTISVRIRNNSFHGGRVPQVGLMVNALYQYNAYWNIAEPYEQDTQFDQVRINGNPLFLGGSPFDYHTDLECQSVLIGAGDPSMPLDPDGSLPDIGVFWNECDVPLPVELLSFNAVPGNNSIALNWSTGSESSVSHFEIERDGTAMAHVTAANRPSGHSYTWLDEDVTNGETYSYTLTSVDLDGSRVVHGTVEATPRAEMLPSEFSLAQNYPNPFNASTMIEYSLPEATSISLIVFNLAGQEVAVLAKGMQSAGRHTVNFNANDLPSGLYFYRLESANHSLQQKMVLLK